MARNATVGTHPVLATFQPEVLHDHRHWLTGFYPNAARPSANSSSQGTTILQVVPLYAARRYRSGQCDVWRAIPTQIVCRHAGAHGAAGVL